MLAPSPSAAVEYGTLEVKNLNNFQKKDQRTAYQVTLHKALQAESKPASHWSCLLEIGGRCLPGGSKCHYLCTQNFI